MVFKILKVLFYSTFPNKFKIIDNSIMFSPRTQIGTRINICYEPMIIIIKIMKKKISQL